MLNVRSHFFAATLSAVSMFFPLPVIYNCNFDRFHLAISGQNRMNWKTDCFPFVSNVYTQLEMHVQWLLPVLFPIFSFSLSLPLSLSSSFTAIIYVQCYDVLHKTRIAYKNIEFVMELALNSKWKWWNDRNHEVAEERIK